MLLVRKKMQSEESICLTISPKRFPSERWSYAEFLALLLINHRWQSAQE